MAEKLLSLESRICVPVQPLPRAELGAQGPVSSLEKANDNCCDQGLSGATLTVSCTGRTCIQSRGLSQLRSCAC